MEKKIFNKLTKEIFLEYGFSKQGKAFVLSLDDVTIVVELRSWRGIKSFDYYLFINALHESSVELISDVYVAEKMEHDPTLSGYHCHEILFEEWTEEEYRELLNKMLHSYFDPFKLDALQLLKKNSQHWLFTKAAEDFLESI